MKKPIYKNWWFWAIIVVILIIIGYAAGVGKTYTMLKAAHSLQKNNIDVVIGYLEPHVFQVERRHKQEQRK